MAASCYETREIRSIAGFRGQIYEGWQLEVFTKI